MIANMENRRCPQTGMSRSLVHWKFLALSVILMMGFHAGSAWPGSANRLSFGISGEDQFGEAVMELIAEATRQGKEVIIRRSYYGRAGEGVVLLPQVGKSSSTVVFSVEIKEPGGAESGSTSSLLDNQDKIIRGLNLICSDQLTVGNRLRQLLDHGSEMEMGMRGLTSGVDGVAVEAAGTSSEVAGISSISVNTDRTLKKINAQLQSLNQMVDALASSMGEVAHKIEDLARADDPWGDDDGFDDDHRSDRGKNSDHDEVDTLSVEGEGGGISGINGGDLASDGNNAEEQSEE